MQKLNKGIAAVIMQRYKTAMELSSSVQVNLGQMLKEEQEEYQIKSGTIKKWIIYKIYQRNKKNSQVQITRLIESPLKEIEQALNRGNTVDVTNLGDYDGEPDDQTEAAMGLMACGISTGNVDVEENDFAEV